MTMMSWTYRLLFPLVDQLFAREKPMLEKHLNSFTTGLELTRSLATNQQEIEEYRKYVQWCAKCEISQQTYPVKDFDLADWEEKRKYKSTDESPYEGHPCTLMGRLLTLGWQGTNGKEGEIYFNNTVKPFVDK